MSQGQAPIWMQVKNLLSAGYGIEDIHVKTAIHLDTIRFLVRKFRSNGELARIYGPKSVKIDIVE